jgi:flagellar biogenesis protein FliO
MEHTLSWWRWLLLFLFMGTLVGTWVYLNRSRLHPSQWLSPTTSLIQVIERKWIGPKNSLLVIRIENQFFLLSQTPHGTAWQKIDPLDLKTTTVQNGVPDTPSPPKIS